MFIRFRDTDKIVKCEVTPIANNICALKFADQDDLSACTNGFSVYLDEQGENDISGDYYFTFSTIYRFDADTKKENTIYLSNDASVYSEKPESNTDDELARELIVENERRLKSEINSKCSELQAAKEYAVSADITVDIGNGVKQTFSTSTSDILALGMLYQRAFNEKPETMIWHDSDDISHYYTSDQIIKIFNAIQARNLYHETYAADLTNYVRSMTDVISVAKVIYGMNIPDQYQSLQLQELIKAGA